MSDITLSLKEVHQLATNCLLASGCDEENARAVAGTIHAAERDVYIEVIESNNLKKLSLLQPIRLIISESILKILSLVFSIIFKKSLSRISTLT